MDLPRRIRRPLPNPLAIAAVAALFPACHRAADASTPATTSTAIAPAPNAVSPATNALPAAVVAPGLPEGYPQGLPYIPGNVSSQALGSIGYLYVYPATDPRTLFAAFSTQATAAGWTLYHQTRGATAGDLGIRAFCRGSDAVSMTFNHHYGGGSDLMLSTRMTPPLPSRGCPSPAGS